MATRILNSFHFEMRFFFNPLTTFSLSLIDFLKEKKKNSRVLAWIQSELGTGKYLTCKCEHPEETLVSSKKTHNYDYFELQQTEA